MAILTWYKDLASFTLLGAWFQILMASLVLVFCVTFDLPISMGLPLKQDLVVTPSVGAVCV